MLPISLHFSAPSGFAVHLRHAALSCRVVCLFFATALLLVGQGKAQEKADQLDDLAQKLRSPDRVVRRSAAEALGKMGPAAVPALIAALKDPDFSVRSSAVEALGGIGPEAKEAVPVLIEALKDQDTNVRSSARMALEKIESAPKKP